MIEKRRMRAYVSLLLLLAMVACTGGASSVNAITEPSLTPTPISIPTPSSSDNIKANVCKSTPNGPGVLFASAVDWHNPGNDPSHSGSVLSLYTAYRAKDGTIRESGEIAGKCWILVNGERYYFDDPNSLIPSPTPPSTPTPSY